MAWAAAADGDEANPEPIGLLLVVGDDAAADPGVRALAERAEKVIAVSMFHGLTVGWADLVLPGTRHARARRHAAQSRRTAAARPPGGRRHRCRTSSPGSRSSPLVSASTSHRTPPSCSRTWRRAASRASPPDDVGEQAPLAERAPYEPPAAATTTAAVAVPVPDEHFLGELRLVRYRPLFSGPLVERVAELGFQRPEAEIELAAADAERREIGNGDVVDVRSNGTSLALRARLNRRLMPGVVRIAEEHAGDLHPTVEVVKR